MSAKDNIRITKLFILYDSESNPFRSLLTYAMDNSTLRKCIIAVAARHFANTGQSFDQTDDALSPRFVNANLDALHFKKQTINSLLLSLCNPKPSQNDAIMSTILLLIFLDLLESGIEGWKYHLHGAKGLVNLSCSLLEPTPSEYVNSNPGDTVHETRRFVARQLSLYASSSRSSVYNVISLTMIASQPSEEHSRVQNRALSFVSTLMIAGIKSPLLGAFWDVLYSFWELSVISPTKDT